MSEGVNKLIGLGSSLKAGAGIGGGIADLLAPSFSRSIAREVNKTTEAYAKVNAKRIAREMRFQQGQASVANAAVGGSNYGSYVEIVADNARAAEENIQSVFLRSKLQQIETNSRTVDPLQSTVSGLSRILGATADLAKTKSEG